MALPEGIADILPLTPVQTGMLFHVLESKDSRGRYVAVLSCRLSGPLDPQRLREAMQDAIQARDAYRAGFVWEDVKQPVQAIREQVELPWTELDWQDNDGTEEQLTALITFEQSRQFDLKQAPLMSATLIKLDQNNWQLVWTIHHLISDGWSTFVVFRDIFERYQDRQPETQKQARFRDYIVWLRKSAPKTDTAYWTQHLEDLAAPSLLPRREQDIEPSALHHHVERHLGEELLRAVEAFAMKQGMTANTILAATWALVLRQMLQQNDVVFGQTTAGRPAEIPGIANAAGAFINTLPFRIKIDPDQSVGAFLAQAAETQQARASHEFASLAEVHACAPIPKGSALFDTLFVNEGIAAQKMDAGDIQLLDLSTTQSSNYALALLATPHNAFKVEIYADPKKLDADQAAECLDAYEKMLQAVIEWPDRAIAELSWQDTPDINVPSAKPFAPVLERIMRCAQENPDALAISDEEQSWTYQTLTHRARQIAFKLEAEGTREGDIVPVVLPRSNQALAAFLGVMMVGAVYVPIDMDYPAHRIEQIFKKSNAGRYICDAETIVRLTDNSASPVMIDVLDEAIGLDEINPGKSAYVIFTSGSQGGPKGVEIEHAALAHSTGVRDEIYGGGPDVYLLLSSLAFDSSVAGIYWTLCTGGHLVLAPKSAEQRPAQLGALIKQHGVSHTLCLPGLAQALLDALPADDLRSLRVLIAAGEVLPPSLLEATRNQLPSCRIFNEYGPTESTVWCTVHEASPSDIEAVPIGRALPGTWVGICDIDGKPLPAGSVGEIVVAGPTLACGYLNDAQQTAARFATLGPDGPRAYRTGDLGRMDSAGVISFLGRRDTQLKIRGHRIELSEIERVAQASLPGIEIIAAVQQHSGRSTITLIIEHAENGAARQSLQNGISAALPPPFHPTDYEFVSSFPRLPNGKTDRNKLIEQNQSHASSNVDDPPQSELEQQLAELFGEVLNIDDFSRNANFFELGGDSLMTLTVFSKGREKNLIFEPADIFEFPTVRELAAYISSGKANEVQYKEFPEFHFANTDGQKEAVLLMHITMGIFRKTAKGLGPDHPVCILFSHFMFGRRMAYSTTVADMAAEAVHALRQMRPHGPYLLTGYSAACPIILEIVRQLDPEDVDRIVLIDPPYLVIGAEPSLQKDQSARRTRLRNQISLGFRIARHLVRAPFFSTLLWLRPKNEWIRQKTIRSAYVFALSRYKIPKYDGKAHILLTAGNPAMKPGDAFDTHLTNKTIHDMPTTHRTILKTTEGEDVVSAKLIEICTNPD